MKPANENLPVIVWKPLILYLIRGLSFVFLLIAMALIFLSCYYMKKHNSGENDNRKNPPSSELKPLDPEPKFVVIMAGDHKPTYLATPAISFNRS